MPQEPTDDKTPPNAGGPLAVPNSKKVLVGDKIEHGADVRPATITDAIKTIRPGDVLNVGSNECANRGFMAGLAVGSGVGIFRVIVLRGIPMSGAHYGVAAGVGTCIVSHQLCLYAAKKEKQIMRRTVEIYHNAKAQNKATTHQAAGPSAAAATAKIVAAPETPAKISWYKVW